MIRATATTDSGERSTRKEVYPIEDRAKLWLLSKHRRGSPLN